MGATEFRSLSVSIGAFPFGSLRSNGALWRVFICLLFLDPVFSVTCFTCKDSIAGCPGGDQCPLITDLADNVELFRTGPLVVTRLRQCTVVGTVILHLAMVAFRCALFLALPLVCVRSRAVMTAARRTPALCVFPPPLLLSRRRSLPRRRLRAQLLCLSWSLSPSRWRSLLRTLPPPPCEICVLVALFRRRRRAAFRLCRALGGFLPLLSLSFPFGRSAGLGSSLRLWLSTVVCAFVLRSLLLIC